MTARAYSEQPPALRVRRKQEALVAVEDVRYSEMLAFDDRLADIEQTEQHGYQRHFRVAGELLAGGAIGAWLTGASFYPTILAMVAAAAMYAASLAIRQANADSIGALLRDFRRVMDSLEVIEVGDEEARP